MAGKQRLASRLNEQELALAMRQRLLHATDWIESCVLPVETSAWRDYRQKIIEAPDQPGWPNKVVWPVPPGRT
jgi:hypothetical protein